MEKSDGIRIKVQGMMPELTDAGVVERRGDGTLVFTHGHRFPDNSQRVVQEYDASGRLQSVKVELTGFAGKVLDVTAVVDEQGRVVKEEGYRAPEVTTTVQELIKPLPAQPQAQVSAGAEVKAGADAGPVVSPSLAPVSGAESGGIRAGLERIYGRLNS